MPSNVFRKPEQNGRIPLSEVSAQTAGDVLGLQSGPLSAEQMLYEQNKMLQQQQHQLNQQMSFQQHEMQKQMEQNRVVEANMRKAASQNMKAMKLAADLLEKGVIDSADITTNYTDTFREE